MRMGFIPKTKCPAIFFNLLCSHPSLPPFSAASFLSLHLMPIPSQSLPFQGAVHRRACSTFGDWDPLKPFTVGGPASLALWLWVAQDSGNRGCPEALIDEPEHSDSTWQAASVIWRNPQEHFAPPGWVQVLSAAASLSSFTPRPGAGWRC